MHPGDAALSAVGTPFYLVFKSVFCVAIAAIAAPVAGIAALSESRFASEARRDLGDGVDQNCGPRTPSAPIGQCRLRRRQEDRWSSCLTPNLICRAPHQPNCSGFR